LNVLVVHSGSKGKISPFVSDQVAFLKKRGVEFDYFAIGGSGAIGYLKKLPAYIKRLKYDLIHAHYGYSGIFANLQRMVPVITTYHGTDINLTPERYFSQFSVWLSKTNIFVSKEQIKRIHFVRNFHLIPCGVDTSIFKPLPKKSARDKFGFEIGKKYILFSSSFDRKVKNYQLAAKVVEKLSKKNNVELIELKNYNRFEVSLLMNAVDVALLTSYTEGSPQFIKEAMACNCPIVTTDVGDVKYLKGKSKLNGFYITSFDKDEIAVYVEKAFSIHTPIYLHKRILELELDNKLVAKKIYSLYKKVIK